VGKKPRPIPRLDQLDTAELVAAMNSPSGWQRDMVQQLLLWRRDKAAIAPLQRMAADSARAQARLQALCTLDALDALRDEVLLLAVADPHPAVRRHAVRLCETRLGRSPALADAIVKLTDDPDAHVRMQLAASLGEWDDPRAGRALGELALRDAADPFVTATVLSSATRNLDELITAAIGRRGDPGAPGPPAELVEKLLSIALASDNTRAVARVLEAVAPGETATKHASWRLSVLGGLLDSLDRRQSSLAKLQRANSELNAVLARLAPLFAAARATATDPQAPPADRVLAVRLLGRGIDQQEQDIAALAALLAPQTSSDLQQAVVTSLGRLRHAAAAEALLAGWPAHGPALRSAVLDVLLSRPEWTDLLLERIENGRVVAGELTAAHRQRLLEHRSPAVRERSERTLGGAGDAARQRVVDEYRRALELHGDFERGVAAFNKHCSVCHKLKGVGHEIGPDLSALTDRSGESMLIAVLDPNRAVEAKYLNYLAATRDGRVTSGMLASETGSSITLLAQEGKRETILRADVEELRSTGKSLMPEGVEKDLTPQDLADVIAYLNSTGPPRKVFDGNKPELVRPEPLRGDLYLLATNAEIYGSTLVFESRYSNLGYWSSADDHAAWTFQVTRPGKYAVHLDWACEDSTAGNSFVIEVGPQRVTGTVSGTGNWDTYKRGKFGELTLDAGQHRLAFRPAGPVSGALIDLRGIKLAPLAK
jgi:putative heme-binding domain-containing protein